MDVHLHLLKKEVHKKVIQCLTNPCKVYSDISFSGLIEHTIML